VSVRLLKTTNATTLNVGNYTVTDTSGAHRYTLGGGHGPLPLGALYSWTL